MTVQFERSGGMGQGLLLNRTFLTSSLSGEPDQRDACAFVDFYVLGRWVTLSNAAISKSAFVDRTRHEYDIGRHIRFSGAIFRLIRGFVHQQTESARAA